MTKRFAWFACLTLVAACSSSSGASGTSLNGDAGGGGDGSSTNGDAGSTGTFTCCLNSVNYACPNQAAFTKCTGFDFAACDSKCAPSDFMCHMNCAQMAANATHDPSACSKTTAACTPVSASCTGVGTGHCTVDSDCGSGNHCTNGACFVDQAGSSCTVDSDCGSGNHCTNGCCLTNSAGNACTVDSDCGSGNHCTNGTCYADATGSPCTVDSDCGGTSCVNGTCQ